MLKFMVLLSTFAPVTVQTENLPPVIEQANIQNMGTISGSIDDVEKYLNTNESNYTWYEGATNSVENVTSKTPSNAHDSYKELISNVLTENNMKSSYGGCGPNAMISILDYFSSALGYTEFVSDSNGEQNKKMLIESVLKNSYTITFSNGQTFMSPFDYDKTFDKIIKDYNLSSTIDHTTYLQVVPGSYDKHLNSICSSIDEGLPVTVFTSGFTNVPGFNNHYFNVYGYKYFTGYEKGTGKVYKKCFFLSKDNYNNTKPCYCDSKILSDFCMGFIKYNINYRITSYYDNDTIGKYFIDSRGYSPYHFRNVQTDILNDDREVILKTNRLRCAYVQNKYIVLSPDKQNAGEAYLDLETQHSVCKLTFDVSFWSSFDKSNGQDLLIQYYENGRWNYYSRLDLKQLPTSKDSSKKINILFNKKIKRFRIYTSVPNPAGDRNKGRIVVKNIKMEYNL